MYRIAVLADRAEKGLKYVEQITRFCTEKGVFPQIECYQDQEEFFEQIQKIVPTSVLLALAGVNGLNAVEHLRSFQPDCGIIWCSDLDFSLHAFRLRVEYFLLEPVTEEALREGLNVWFDRREHMKQKKRKPKT